MTYTLSKKLPKDNQELVRRLSLRWCRAVHPHNIWARKAKLCTEFVEGRQYTDDELAAYKEIKRNALTLNKIAPLYRLIMGYQSSNRLDVNYQPTSDSQASEATANVLNSIYKAEAGRTDLKFIDSEVFSDGIITGRGFWDLRLCFENNDFGEILPTASDPFSTYIDPDANTYDLEKSAAYIQDSVWTDIDKIGATFGLEAAEAVQYLSNPNHSSNMFTSYQEQDIAPERYFGMYADEKAFKNWNDVYNNDFVDRQAKRYRLLDTQYKITSIVPCFIDLETGDKRQIPDDWFKPENQYKIQAALDHAQKLNNPIKIAHRPMKRTRWTISCADVILFDGWSPYETYTKIGFFPYFRRGATRGFVDDLIDPQREINKKRSALADILNRNANSGWMYEEGTLDAEQEENLRLYGSSPGINVKWKAGPTSKNAPARIEPGGYPQGLDRLEEKNTLDLNAISGINESALGQLDKVQSGRAIEARQRQAVLSIQLYQDNFSRSKKLCGRKTLEIFQQHYTEERIYRVMGEDSSAVIYEINKKIETGENGVTRLNDITVGKYSVEIDEVPISATFKQGQFEETMLLLEKLGPIGALLAQTKPDLIIDQSSLPRKQEWKQALGIAAQQAQAQAAIEQQPAGAPQIEGAGPVPAPDVPQPEEKRPVIKYDNMGNRV